MKGVIGLVWRHNNGDYEILLDDFTEKNREYLDSVFALHKETYQGYGIRGDKTISLEDALVDSLEKDFSKKTRNQQRLKLAHEIFQYGYVETNLLYDDGKEVHLTYEDIANDLLTPKGATYTLETLMQFCDGSQEPEDHSKIFELSMKIVRYMEGFDDN